MAGEISLSRYNPNVAYIRVDGLDRDIRISGFGDRNRAFNGDKVTVSIYPKIEWLSAIAPEIKEFQKRMDERERLETIAKEEAEKQTEDDDDVNEVNEAILDTLTQEDDGGASSSSSHSDTAHDDESSDDEQNGDSENKQKVKADGSDDEE